MSTELVVLIAILVVSTADLGMQVWAVAIKRWHMKRNTRLIRECLAKENSRCTK